MALVINGLLIVAIMSITGAALTLKPFRSLDALIAFALTLLPVSAPAQRYRPAR